MKTSVAIDYLTMVKGKPIIDVGRAADMAWFALGEIIKAKDYKGNDVLKSSYSLHLQCPWRMIDSERRVILFTSYDMYVPNSSTEWTEDFDWDIQGINLFDEKIKKWRESSEAICITDFYINPYNDLRLIISNNNILEVFINKTTDAECWRFFEYNSDRNHLVIRGDGIYY